MTPLDVINKVSLENDILGLQDLFIPLSSSHTQSGDGEQGAPEKSEDELSEAGTATRDADGNDRRING